MKVIKDEYLKPIVTGLVILCLAIILLCVFAANVSCTSAGKVVQIPEETADAAMLKGKVLHDYLVDVIWPKVSPSLSAEERVFVVQHYETFMASLTILLEEIVVDSDTEKQITDAMIKLIPKLIDIFGE